MKQQMSFKQAVEDPNRPLSITPREWMYAVQAQLQEQNQLVDQTINRIASQQKKKKVQVQDGMEKIQIGIDQIVSGIKIVNQGLIDANIADLKPMQRKIVDKVKQLLETAIQPYMVDMIEQMDKLQNEE